MIGVLGTLLVALNLAAPIEHAALKSEYWVSAVGLYRITVPKNWQMEVKVDENSGLFEDLRVGPKSEPTVSITILSRRSDRPMTSIHADQHLRGLLAGYLKDKEKYRDVRVERGPNKVPVGNLESWGYLIIYNTKAQDGSKVSVRETVNYVNRRMNDLAYLHHILIGRCPLPVASTYSPNISRFMENLLWQLPDKPGKKTSAAPGEDEEEDDAASPSPDASPGPAPSKKASSK